MFLAISENFITLLDCIGVDFLFIFFVIASIISFSADDIHLFIVPALICFDVG